MVIDWGSSAPYTASASYRFQGKYLPEGDHNLLLTRKLRERDYIIDNDQQYSIEDHQVF